MAARARARVYGSMIVMLRRATGSTLVRDGPPTMFIMSAQGIHGSLRGTCVVSLKGFVIAVTQQVWYFTRKERA